MEDIIYKDVMSKKKKISSSFTIQTQHFEVSSIPNIVILILTFYEDILLKRMLGI